MQLVQRYDRCTKIHPISVHHDLKEAINKFATIMMNFIDERKDHPDTYLDLCLTSEIESREILADIDHVEDYIAQYIFIKAPSIIDEFSFSSEQLKFFDCGDKELLLCDNNNNICEVRHSEFTLSLIKTVFK